ncbi:transporter substrate-binding domain-containing protein [Legionella jordanis]|uniref:Arginine-binding periplasmic protein n=1 Tax=Legionella jordanis TaxID=456 RepID=A0A0W0VCE2_9GAMM|nr:transporter substrate-binding domain-containing protein [Legionella jordanis]KTD17752.1 arginine-binding periplasmic protein [Legionella jordanis]RMX01615.1 hypothetical protein EAW55_11030 [Legionella jordanis]RMX21611.1 hypothetical protein EAS68_02310 [Legionella jordanis]VEH11313.1 arginine-binding periplasmic protein [Legionella jordanis]
MKLLKALLFSLPFLFSTTFTYATVRVGTVFFFPPFVTSLNEGFDIELVRSICQRLNLSCELQPMDFNKLFPALDNGSIDLAIGGIVISQIRQQKYDFSLPYMLSKGQFLVTQNSNVQTVNDLKGQKVGVIKGEQDNGVFISYLNDNFPGQFSVSQFDDMEDLITALSANQISAAFTHESTALYWQENGGGQFKLLAGPVLLGQGIGIMALPKNAALLQQINQALQDLEKDGSYLNLYQTYFGNEK